MVAVRTTEVWTMDSGQTALLAQAIAMPDGSVVAAGVVIDTGAKAVQRYVGAAFEPLDLTRDTDAAANGSIAFRVSSLPWKDCPGCWDAAVFRSAPDRVSVATSGLYSATESFPDGRIIISVHALAKDGDDLERSTAVLSTTANPSYLSYPEIRVRSTETAPKAVSDTERFQNLVVYNTYDVNPALDSDIYGRLIAVDSEGKVKTVGEQARLTLTKAGLQDQPDVTRVGSKDVVVWSGDSELYQAWGVGRDIFFGFARWNSDGPMPIAMEYMANVDTYYDQIEPVVAAIGSQRFVIAWQTSKTTTATRASSEKASVPAKIDGTISARVFNSEGTALTGEIKILTPTDGFAGHDIDVVALTQDADQIKKFAVTWVVDSYDDSSAAKTGSELHFALYKANGEAIGGYRIDLGDTNGTRPGIEAMLDGRFAVSWFSDEGTLQLAVLDTARTGRILEGDAGDNILIGTAFNDTIYGRAGNDTLYSGKGGKDTFIGGSGADKLIDQTGKGQQTASYVSASSGVSVNVATGRGTKGDAGGDVLSGFSNLIGSNYGDTLVGDAGTNKLIGLGGNDALSGLAGDDILYPGTGRDIVDGGEGTDIVSYAGFDEGVTVNLGVSDGLGNSAEAVDDTIMNVEGVAGTNAADVLIGTNSANTLTGNGGPDVLKGLGGADTLRGGPGKDILSPGPGADAIIVDQARSASRDTVYGFATGYDQIKLSLRGDYGEVDLTAGAWTENGQGAFIKGASPAATKAIPTILYDTGSGLVTVDLDGTATAYKTVEILLLDGAPQLAASDFVLF